MSLEDDLETDLASLRRELLDWILTEIRSGRDRESLAGSPLAQDLAEVVRGGVQGAVDLSVKRIEDQRASVLVEALAPIFAQLAEELAQRGEGADARLVSLERSIAEVAAAPRGGARNGDRTDEILREIRNLGGGGGEAAPARVVQPRMAASAEPLAMSRNRQAIGAGVGIVLLLLAGGAGWVLHSPGNAAPLAPEADVADQAHQLQNELSDLSNATPAAGSANAPKVDPQTIAGDVADIAAAMEQAANATTPADLHKAHQAANDAISQLKAVLDFDNPGKHPAANALDAPPPTSPPAHAPPSIAHSHAPAAHQPASTPAPAPAAGGAPATPADAGGGH